MQTAVAQEVSGPLRTIRRTILEAASKAKEGHVPSAFSILDILWVLYAQVMNVGPHNINDETRDRFVLSKGHASLGLYAVLAHRGFFPLQALDKFGAFDSILGGHPDSTKVPGVEASTGSLGHGFPIAVGIAMGQRIRKMKSRTFCLIGDGEANEGSVWEAALLGAHHKLNNLYCIIDHNHSTDRALDLGNLAAKFQSFGWAVLDVDGHDHAALYQALTAVAADKPTCVVAHTIKGKGCPPMENNPAWHHKSPTPAELAELLVTLT